MADTVFPPVATSEMVVLSEDELAWEIKNRDEYFHVYHPHKEDTYGLFKDAELAAMAIKGAAHFSLTDVRVAALVSTRNGAFQAQGRISFNLTVEQIQWALKELMHRLDGHK